MSSGVKSRSPVPTRLSAGQWRPTDCIESLLWLVTEEGYGRCLDIPKLFWRLCHPALSSHSRAHSLEHYKHTQEDTSGLLVIIWTHTSFFLLFNLKQLPSAVERYSFITAFWDLGSKSEPPLTGLYNSLCILQLSHANIFALYLNPCHPLSYLVALIL